MTKPVAPRRRRLPGRGTLPALGLVALSMLAPPLQAQSDGARTDRPAARQPQPRISNPDLYTKSLKAAIAAIEQYGTIDSGDQVERVNRIGYRLAYVSGFEAFPFTFGVVDMPIPNAFALPAGQIFVTRGMLDLGLTDDQLAALLGHEIGHVTEEHFLRLRRKATLLNTLAQLAVVGAIAAQSGSSSDVYQGPGGLLVRGDSSTDLVTASYATGVVVSELLLRSYNRDMEDESDEEGQRMAALAGFDPDGARQLMAKMRQRIPQEKSFGYWQTHPFFDQRVVAAEARAAALTAQPEPEPAALERYRQDTQAVLLESLDLNKLPEAAGDTVKDAALAAWPAGDAADRIRVERLRRLREREMEKLAQSRDYGRVIRAYEESLETVRKTSGDQSSALALLRQDLGELRTEREELFADANRILEGGVYQIPFLESYASNFPDSPRSAQVALDLALAYSRLGRESQAVEQFLRVLEVAEEDEPRQKAARGLRSLAPLLHHLAALERLATQERDPELAERALARLEEQVTEFDELRNGADYLAEFPEGLYAETVASRLDTLATHRYQEMRLYQELGQSAKAIAAASDILEHAPLSSAAARLGRELDAEGIAQEG